MIRSGMFIENRYEILEKIGTGGMSDVYKARCHKLNRFVAIKFLKPEFCEDKNFVSNFKVEAQSAAALLHPNVVNVYDVNETDGIYYIVMEYVDGITLKKYININGKLPVKEATSIAIQMVQGMEAAHNAGIVHRDIKPQNVLISREGKIKVTDFGIARTTTANTLSSDVLGSAQYISPEQARGDAVDIRSDIYSFGIVFYEMLTGKLPFNGESPVTVALKHIQEQVPLVSDEVSDVPSSVVKIVEKCTQKRVEKRYQKTSSLLADLKTSLVNPNDDFVMLDKEDDSGATVIMNKKDVEALREGEHKAAAAPVKNTVKATAERENVKSKTVSKKPVAVPVKEEDDDDDEIEEDKTGRKFDKILAICGVAAGIIIIIVLILIFVTNVFGNGGCSGCSGSNSQSTTATSSDTTAESTTEAEKMPSLIGLSLTEAKSQLDKMGVSYIVKTENSTAQKNTVTAQSINAGDPVQKGATVTLTVSEGEETVKLTDLTNLTQEAAESKIKSLGLKVKVTTEYSDTVDAGKVISTDPKADSELAKNSTVTIVVSLGKETKSATVPNCVGSTQSAAESMCTSAGLSVSVEISITVNQGNDGKVLAQSLTAGDSVDQGTEIVLTVGQYKEPETTTKPTETTTEETTTPTTEASSDTNQN